MSTSTASSAETLAVLSSRAGTTKLCATASIIAQLTDIRNAMLSVAASHGRDRCGCISRTRLAGHAKTVQQAKNPEKIIPVRSVAGVQCSRTTRSNHGDALLACTHLVQPAKGPRSTRQYQDSFTKGATTALPALIRPVQVATRSGLGKANTPFKRCRTGNVQLASRSRRACAAGESRLRDPKVRSIWTESTTARPVRILDARAAGCPDR